MPPSLAVRLMAERATQYTRASPSCVVTFGTRWRRVAGSGASKAMLRRGTGRNGGGAGHGESAGVRRWRIQQRDVETVTRIDGARGAGTPLPFPSASMMVSHRALASSSAADSTSAVRRSRAYAVGSGLAASSARENREESSTAHRGSIIPRSARGPALYRGSGVAGRARGRFGERNEARIPARGRVSAPAERDARGTRAPRCRVMTSPSSRGKSRTRLFSARRAPRAGDDEGDERRHLPRGVSHSSPRRLWCRRRHGASRRREARRARRRRLRRGRGRLRAIRRGYARSPARSSSLRLSRDPRPRPPARPSRPVRPRRPPTAHLPPNPTSNPTQARRVP